MRNNFMKEIRLQLVLKERDSKQNCVIMDREGEVLKKEVPKKISKWWVLHNIVNALNATNGKFFVF